MPRAEPPGREKKPTQATTLQLAILCDEPPPPGSDPFERFSWGMAGTLTLRQAWRQNAEWIVGRWAEAHPGSRPKHWWRWDAPEPRKRLGGVGTPAHQVLAYELVYDRGIPGYWVEPWMHRYFNGQFRTVKGKLVKSRFHPGDFPHPPVSPTDPPRYESEAAFLDRHKLLTAAERAVLDRDGWPPDEAVVIRPDDP
jgi:hypothetical protein